jgi:(2Fe-2S) ferredoxin
LLGVFREEVELRGIPSSAVLRNVCTRRHEEGPVVFIYPDDVWYTRVKPEDVPEIVERHLAPKTPPAPTYAPSPSRRR